MSGNVHNMKESWDLTGVLPVFAQPVKLAVQDSCMMYREKRRREAGGGGRRISKRELKGAFLLLVQGLYHKLVAALGFKYVYS